MKQKIALIIVLVIILAGLGVLTFVKQRATIAPTEVQMARKDVPVTVLPEKFPPDVPLNPQDAIVSNYTVTKPNGTTESVRVYLTRLGVIEEASRWNQYISKNGWTVQTVHLTDTDTVVSAKKDTLYMSLVIKLQPGGGSEVQIRFQ